MTVSSVSQNPLKRCPSCKKDFPHTEEFFHKNKYARSGLTPCCKSCNSARSLRNRRARGINAREEVLLDGKRKCAGCGQWIPATAEYFYRDKNGRLGLATRCKPCIRGQVHEYRNSDAGMAAIAAYRGSEDTKVRQRAQRKEYHQREDFKVRNRARAKTPSSRQYRERYTASERYRSLMRLYESRRRTTKLGLPNAFTDADWQYALNYFDNSCAVCGKRPDFWTILAADHWIPLKSATCPGTIPSNIVPLCHARKDGEACCNNSKGALVASEWLLERFGERKAKQVLQKIDKYFASVNARKSNVA